MVCDDFETIRNHPECRRVAGLVVDAASHRAEFRLTSSERKKAWGAAFELLQVGHAPEAIAQAIADAPARTFPSITLQLNQARVGPRRIRQATPMSTGLQEQWRRFAVENLDGVGEADGA
ncbi:MAG: hypothetical protein M3256_17885 [Actinomycetota bacterium]|nr:hypothetical protein [Actinomycetota bacterium]